jgi:hypothetical protein
MVVSRSAISDPAVPLVAVYEWALTRVAGVTAEPLTLTLPLPDWFTAMTQPVPAAGTMDAGIVAVTGLLFVKMTSVPQSVAAKL